MKKIQNLTFISVKDELECLSPHPLGFDREEMGLVNNYKKDK